MKNLITIANSGGLTCTLIYAPFWQEGEPAADSPRDVEMLLGGIVDEKQAEKLRENTASALRQARLLVAQPPTWEEFLANHILPENRPYFYLIRRIVEEMDWVGQSAYEHGPEHYLYSFSDGKALAFTHRAWGDLMAAIVGRREGYTAYLR